MTRNFFVTALTCFVLLVIAGSGCRAKPSTSAEKAPTATPSTGVVPTTLKATSSHGDKLTLIEGSCEGGRELGALADYSIRLRAKQGSLGFIRVRREAKWPAENLSNVLGTVPCGTILWGQGPLKNADDDGSCGVGYAVAVRDSQGRQCRGYVSYTVVEVLDEHGGVVPGP